jgi:hypothetical protein
VLEISGNQLMAQVNGDSTEKEDVMLFADMLVDMLAQLDQVNSLSVVAQVEIHGSQTNVDTTVWGGNSVEQDGGTFASRAFQL